MSTEPLEFAVLVAGLRSRRPFADDVVRSNAERTRYPSWAKVGDPMMLIRRVYEDE